MGLSIGRRRWSSLDAVNWAEFDFIDLGCSNGGSIEFAVKRFNARRGIGVDIDPAKLDRAADLGFDVVAADARSLNLAKRVRFVSMLDFLEHLPDLETVEAVLASAAEAATDFLFIKHPSFEGEELAETLGIRQYWWNWSGHTAHIRVSEYCEMFDRLGLRQYLIRNVEPIHESTHPSIIPFDAPRNVVVAVDAANLEARCVEFDPPLWRMQHIFVALRAIGPAEWNLVTGEP